MDDRLSRVEAGVSDLEASIRRIEQRLAAVEQTVVLLGGAEPVGRRERADLTDLPVPVDLREQPAPAFARDDLVTVLSFIGRTFVALGGAFLLRALTDATIIPVPRGTALGLAYAVGWLVMSDRAAAARQPTSAAFHGLVAIIIAFPLLWESVTRFQLLTAGSSAVALAVVSALTLAAALRQRSQPLAWMSVISALATALALVAATREVLPFAVVMIALGVATLWIGYSADWVLLRWPVALVADLMVIALTLRATGGNWPDPPPLVIGVQLLLLTSYLASVAARTLLRGRDVNAFEGLQTAAVLAVGFGGAVYVARQTGFGTGALAVVNLLTGAGCYAVALAFVARQRDPSRNFMFYTSLGLVLVLVSLAMLLPAPVMAMAWTALAVLTAVSALRTGRVTLNSHAAVYATAAAAASGLLVTATAALIGNPGTEWPSMSWTALVVLVGVAACWAVPMADTAGVNPVSRIPRVLITIVLIWAAGGWVVGGAAAAIAGGLGQAPDAGVVATVRTSVLAAAALILASVGRSERFRESGWLLYPLLAAGALKLLAEDLPRSRPATLFIALALYGGALIVAPRLARGTMTAAPKTRA